MLQCDSESVCNFNDSKLACPSGSKVRASDNTLFLHLNRVVNIFVLTSSLCQLFLSVALMVNLLPQMVNLSLSCASELIIMFCI